MFILICLVLIKEKKPSVPTPGIYWEALLSQAFNPTSSKQFRDAGAASFCSVQFKALFRELVLESAVTARNAWVFPARLAQIPGHWPDSSNSLRISMEEVLIANSVSQAGLKAPALECCLCKGQCRQQPGEGCKGRISLAGVGRVLSSIKVQQNAAALNAEDLRCFS